MKSSEKMITAKEWHDKWFLLQDTRIDNWLFVEFLEKRIDIHQLNDLIVLYGGFESHEHMWFEYEIELFFSLFEDNVEMIKSP